MEAYSLAKRNQIIADCNAGMKTGLVIKKHEVSGTFVRTLKRQWREVGQIAAARVRGNGCQPKIDRTRLVELVAADADATLAELGERLGVACSLSAIWSALDKLRITFKKKRCGPPSRTGRTSSNDGRRGVCNNSASIRSGSSLSTKRGRQRT